MINRDIRSLAKSLAKHLKPKPNITMLEYVEKYGYVITEGEQPTKWHTRPYQEAWFIDVTNPRVQCSVCMKPSRVGWSEFVKFCIQYFSEWRKTKMLVVQPTDEEVKKYSSEDVDSLFHPLYGAPRLKGLLSRVKSRNEKNTYSFKKLKNGTIIQLAHAGSPVSARRVNRPVILLEEPAAYEQRKEGDIIQLFLQRAGTAVNPFFTIGGTPVIPNDLMEQCFKMGDQQYRYYPCPHCGHYQELMTRGAWQRFVTEGQDAGKIKCENCETLIEYRYLHSMDAKAGWACPLDGCDRSNQIMDEEGFPIWASRQIGPGMSYHRAASWFELARRYRNAKEQLRKGNPDPMQSFHNTDRGIPWDPTSASKINAEGLTKRQQDESCGNNYPPDGEHWTVPNGAVLITIGVDTQGGGGTADEGLRGHVWAWGRGDESWHVAEFRIDRDPTLQSTLDELDVWLEAEWQRQDGAILKAALGTIDEGGLATEAVRRWCSTRVGRWVPVRGIPRPDHPLLGRGAAVFVDSKNKAANRVGRDLLMFQVGYERSVTLLMTQLNVSSPGAGYIHLGRATSAETLQELFPWRRAPVTPRSQTYHWTLPPGAHDEAGDCRRYAYAALQLIARRFSRVDLMWAQYEASALATIGAAQPAAPLLGLNFA